MDKQELRSLVRDLRFIERTRSELAANVAKIMVQVGSTSTFCQTMELLIRDLQRRIDAPDVVKRAPKKKKK